eukprot:scaffold47909_cov30-Tisochrysis_lutea.AAC.1
MPSDDPEIEVDFLRFFGLRSADTEGEDKDANVLVGTGSLGLRADASLLAVSNRFGLLFAGTANGFRWASLKELREHCKPGGEGGAAATFHAVSCAGKPLCLRLNADDSLLATIVVSGSEHKLEVYDVIGMVQGAGSSSSPLLMSQGLTEAAGAIDIQTSPTDPHSAVTISAVGDAILLCIHSNDGGINQLKLALPMNSLARSVGWSTSGANLFVGCTDGSVVRCSVTAPSTEGERLLAPPSGLDNHEVTLVSTISERFVLLGYDLPDVLRKEDPYTEPAVRVLDVKAAGDGAGEEVALHECAAGLFAGVREPGEADGELARRRLHCASLPAWRLAVVCSSDSDAVSCIGSRKGGETQRWQKWTLPDEEGPPSVPTFELGDVFEDQYIMGLGFDFGNEEQLVVVAGEHEIVMIPVLMSILQSRGIFEAHRRGSWTLL